MARQKEYLDAQSQDLIAKRDKERHIENAHSKEFEAQQAKLAAVDIATSDLQKATKLATKQYNEALVKTEGLRSGSYHVNTNHSGVFKLIRKTCESFLKVMNLCNSR